MCSSKMYILLQTLLVSTVLAAGFKQKAPSYFGVISATDQINGTAQVDSSPLTPFMAPKMLTINQSNWDEWYCDSITSDGTQGVAVLFARDATLTRDGIPIIRVSLDAVWANGTTFTTMLFATNSSVEQKGDNIYGLWTGDDWSASFLISEDNRQALISINSSIVTGTYRIQSFTTPHYANTYSFPDPRGRVEFLPMIYWNTPVPAGSVEADFTINGTAFQHTDMVGGIDRNWAPYAYDYIGDDWWWCRVIVGKYTARFWIIKSSINNETSVGASVENDHAILFDSNDLDEVDFVLNYNGTTHGQFEDLSTGWTMTFTPKNGMQAYTFTIEHTRVWFEADKYSSNNMYSRFTNTASGGPVGGQTFEGVATNEQAHFIEVLVIPPVA